MATLQHLLLLLPLALPPLPLPLLPVAQTPLLATLRYRAPLQLLALLVVH